MTENKDNLKEPFLETNEDNNDIDFDLEDSKDNTSEEISFEDMPEEKADNISFEDSSNDDSNNFSDTSANLKSITDSISEANISLTMRELNETIKGLNLIVSSIENGKGTLGKIVNDESLYESLIDASDELESLLSDLKNHPKRYINLSIFGKKQKPYIPEENNQ